MDDRNVEPDYFWLFQKYTNYILGKYGDMSGPNVYLRGSERINSYNEKNGKILAKFTEERETIVTIGNDFNRRVHERLPQASDIVLVCATSNLARHDTKVFHLICPSPAGGLPPAVCRRKVKTLQENIKTVEAGFELIKSLLPAEAFFHHGPEGPRIAMTDDCEGEQQALLTVRSGVTLLLCVFLLLQPLWRELLEVGVGYFLLLINLFLHANFRII